jgi:hypothetical protein
MKRRVSASVAVGVLLCSGAAFAQGGGTPAKARATAPEIAFESVPNFLKLPAGLYMGEAVGVATNSKGHLFVFVRSGETRLCSSNSNDSESMDHGEIYKIQLTGPIVGKFGKAGKLPREFGMVNAIDCRTENDLWVGEVWNWRAQKVTLRR